MTEPIIIKRRLGNMFTRWGCDICNGPTDKTAAPYAFLDDAGKERFVCDACVEAGVEAISERLRRTAFRYEVFARDLRTAADLPWAIEQSRDPDSFTDEE
jgi:hypothetical protein